MKICILGGLGHIGSGLVRYLLAKYPTLQITIIDNFSTGKYHSLFGQFHLLDRLVELDVRDDSLEKYILGQDIVLHLAAITKAYDFADIEYLFDHNLASTKNCYVGIPCGCCNINMAKWYIDNFKLHPYYTTFANIFVNKNWKNWINFLIDEKFAFTFIGPCNLPNTFIVQNYIHIPLYLVNDWDSKGEEYLSIIINEIKKNKNRLFLFSGGPISKILIANAWNQHPYNIYLDIGSSFDMFMKGSTNREYAIDGSPLSQLECKFDSNLIKI